MKTAWNILGTIHIVLILALIGLVVFLAATGRLDRQRITEAAEVFRMTNDEVQALAEQAEMDKQAADKVAAEQAQLAEGGKPVKTRLLESQRLTEADRQRMALLSEQATGLRQNLRIAELRIEQQSEELDRRKKDLEQMIADKESRLVDEGFKKTIALYEQLPAKQSKQMFMNLLANSEMDQVVAYLEAMQPRKAAGILREFKAPDEVAAVVALTERLRARGSDVGGSVDQVSQAPLANTPENIQ